jgi:tetratricopeptide (TPR) repeat protein
MKRLVALVVAICAGTAHASPEDANAEAARGKSLYVSGDFRAAADAYRKAYELDAQSEYLFGWAQALRRGGDCAAALELYSKLLAMPLSETDTAATHQSMARCDATKSAVRRDPWYRDRRGNVLTGGGIIAIGVGTWLTVQSVSDERAARAAPTYGEHDRLGDRATVLRVVGISALALGAVSTSLGVYSYRTRGTPQRAVGAWGGGASAGFAIGGTW